MNFTLIPDEKINQIENDLAEIKSLLQSKESTKPSNEWLSKKEAKERLHVCMKTLDKYLKDRVIPYSQFGAKVYIKVTDLESHMQKHFIKGAV